MTKKRKPQAEMEMIFIASDGNALKTGVGAAGATNAETWAMFRNARRAAVPQLRAQFLLDYYSAKGDLVDTIFLDASGYRLITGERVKTEAQYRKIDAAYWAKVTKNYRKQKAAAANAATA